MDSTQHILQNLLVNKNANGIELLPLRSTPARIHYYSETIPLGTNPSTLLRGVDFVVLEDVPLYKNRYARLYIGKLLRDVDVYLPSRIQTFRSGVRILVYIRNGHIVVALNPELWDKRSITYIQHSFDGFLTHNNSSNRTKTRNLMLSKGRFKKKRSQTRKSKRV